MQIKAIALALATAASLVSAAPADNVQPTAAAAVALHRRDIPESLDSIATKINELGQNLDSVVGQATSQWQGSAGESAAQALQQALSALTDAKQTVAKLSEALSQGCGTYNDCEASIPF